MRFAELSGDWNPIHIDPIAARRTPYGQIVHGVHAVVWILDKYLSESDFSSPSKIKVGFLKPIPLSEAIHVVRNQEGLDHVFMIQLRNKVLVSIRITPGTGSFAADCKPVPDLVPMDPASKTFAELRGHEGSLESWGAGERLKKEFPNLVKSIGTLRVASLLALSRLVGMVCPGLNSIFSGLEFNFIVSQDLSIPYKVSRHSIPNAPVRVSFSGGGLEGHLDAFLRPSPAQQIGMHELQKWVKPDEFMGQTALVIGGSRGLGESVAKIIAAGGGFPIITYHLGAIDANKVAFEIMAAGGQCRTLQLGVGDSDKALAHLVTSGVTISHAYYFASPIIQNNKGSPLDRKLLESYLAYYVEGFDRICRSLVTQAKGSNVRVFYPSTVYLQEAAPGFAEYVCAKAAGETLCRFLAHDFPNLSIQVERLPRMHTDQTNSFVEKKATDPHEVMLATARKMSLEEAIQWV